MHELVNQHITYCVQIQDIIPSHVMKQDIATTQKIGVNSVFIRKSYGQRFSAKNRNLYIHDKNACTVKVTRVHGFLYACIAITFY